jgi:hypothetical protein
MTDDFPAHASAGIRVWSAPAAPTKAAAPRELLRFVEQHARQIRRNAGLGDLEPVRSTDLVGEFGIILACPNDINALSPQDRTVLTSLDARAWSGAGLPLPDGRTLVLLNPHQTDERANVTIMEEIAHVHFGHSPSQLIANGLVRRTFDPGAERDAYWTAAATLLPSEVIAKAVWSRADAWRIGHQFHASVDLVEFRIKILRLWNQYCQYARQAS